MLDEATNRWLPRGDIADLFLPNCQPIKMADGNWIMAGRAASRFGVKPFIPAVAISQGDDLTGRWNVVPLQTEMTPAHCPETTVWVEGRQLVALTRNNTGAAPFVYASQDYGRTWNAVKDHTLTASASKLYAGHLSTGERYVVFNLPAEGETGFRSRETLAIGVSRPGELAPEKIWRVQDRTAPVPRRPSTIPAPSNTRGACSCSTPPAAPPLGNANWRSSRSRRSNSRTAEAIRKPNP